MKRLEKGNFAREAWSNQPIHETINTQYHNGSVYILEISITTATF